MYHVDQSVLRLRSHGRVYHLVFLPVRDQPHGLAVVQGRSEGVEGVQEGHSHDPRIGARSLWEVPLPAWIGQRLVVGTVTTGPIEGVAREMDADRAGGITAALREVARKAGVAVDEAPTSPSGHPQPLWDAQAAIVELELAAVQLSSGSAQRLATHAPSDPALLTRARVALERCRRAVALLQTALQPP